MEDPRKWMDGIAGAPASSGGRTAGGDAHTHTHTHTHTHRFTTWLDSIHRWRDFAQRGGQGSVQFVVQLLGINVRAPKGADGNISRSGMNSTRKEADISLNNHHSKS